MDGQEGQHTEAIETAPYIGIFRIAETDPEAVNVEFAAYFCEIDWDEDRGAWRAYDDDGQKFGVDQATAALLLFAHRCHPDRELPPPQRSKYSPAGAVVLCGLMVFTILALALIAYGGYEAFLNFG